MSGRTCEIHVERTDTSTIVQIIGDLDSSSFENFKSTLTTLINTQPVKVVLDCTGLSYINSRSIGLLTQAHRKAMANFGKIVFVGLSDRMMRSLERLKLQSTFTICNDRAEANEQFDS